MWRGRGVSLRGILGSDVLINFQARTPGSSFHKTRYSGVNVVSSIFWVSCIMSIFSPFVCAIQSVYHRRKSQIKYKRLHRIVFVCCSFCSQKRPAQSAGIQLAKAAAMRPRRQISKGRIRESRCFRRKGNAEASNAAVLYSGALLISANRVAPALAIETGLEAHPVFQADAVLGRATSTIDSGK